MIKGLIDKTIFGIVLLALFQLPLLSDHYYQYLTGYAEAKAQEINHQQQLAARHGYPSINAMLDEHMKANLASIREDAQHTRLLLEEYQSLQAGLALFEGGRLLPRLNYMFNPSRIDQLNNVIRQFEPGIPLSPNYLLICALIALLFNSTATLPIKLAQRRIRKKKEALKKS